MNQVDANSYSLPPFSVKLFKPHRRTRYCIPGIGNWVHVAPHRQLYDRKCLNADTKSKDGRWFEWNILNVVGRLPATFLQVLMINQVSTDLPSCTWFLLNHPGKAYMLNLYCSFACFQKIHISVVCSCPYSFHIWHCSFMCISQSIWSWYWLLICETKKKFMFQLSKSLLIFSQTNTQVQQWSIYRYSLWTCTIYI